MNLDYLCLGQKKSFPTVYNMPMFMSFSQGFQSENLAQNLDFLHHFWVSRNSGNPVISSPVKKHLLDLGISYLSYMYNMDC